MKPIDLKVFIAAYIECALWSSTDDNDTPLDQYEGEISDLTRQDMEADCLRFVSENAALIEQARNVGDYANPEWSVEARAGHDFWLTRNGHGCGFWDRHLGEVGEKLTEAAKQFQECSLYVGDDGEIWA